MSNATSSMVSSSSRPLRMAMRADLHYDRQTYQGRDYWVVKDPLSLKYFRFEEEEFCLLKMIDGRSSPDQIKRRFDYQFAPQKISLQELHQLVGMLYRSSLLVSDSAGQGIELKKRSDQSKSKRFKSKFTNILAVQFRGFDPGRMLDVANRFVGGIFSTGFLVFSLILGLSAIALLLTQWDTFQARLPNFHEFFAAKNWIWLALTIGLTKVIHEFGHGISCRRFGGECHEMGVMFLVLTPCLYCNVSDAWTLPNKWQRIVIAAAGMYVELVLAAGCTFIWWFSQPGMVNSLALNVMFVCSVSTLLFNANPLLRYDGYYILSDVLEIPNLRQKATTVLRQTVGRWALGLSSSTDPFLPTRHKWLFVTYSIAAAFYKWFITLSIFFFVYKLLEPYGFKIIGQAIAMMALYGLIGQPMVQLFKFFSVPGRLHSVKPLRTSVSLGLIALIIIGILMIPIPFYVRCSLCVQPQNAKAIYVDAAGEIETILKRQNQFVQQGEIIVRLKNHDLDYELLELESERDVAKVQYKTATYMASYDDRFSGEVEVAEATYVSTANQLKQRGLDKEQLAVRAPATGYLISADYVNIPPDDNGQLPGWHGRPLEKRNHGAFLKEGTLIGKVVPDLSEMEAVLAIDQSDIEFISAGQSVEMWIEQCPGQTFESATEHISMTKMKVVPKALSSKYGGSLITKTDVAGNDVPYSTTYRVSVPLSNNQKKSPVVIAGSCGTAKIRAGSRTVGQRLWRLVFQTFRFKL